MANRYWVGGTGTWDTSATTHWSTSSGGSSGASAPGSSDVAIFDGSSGGGTVTINNGITIAGFNSAAFSGAFSGNLFSISGASRTAVLGKNLPGLLVASSSSVSITSNGNAIASLRVSGSVSCTDALAVDALILDETSAVLSLKNGVTSTVSTSITWPASAACSLNSVSAGTRATLSKSTGEVITRATVTDIAFTGGATWSWGSGSTDGGNNTGISTVAVTSNVLFGDFA